MKILCLYHNNCYDGMGAAWSVRHWARKHPEVQIEYRGSATGKTPEDATGFDMLFLLDFTYSREQLEPYYMQGMKQILIVDHHKSNWLDHGIAKLAKAGDIKGPPYDILGSRGMWAIYDMERSGAGLAWDVFNPEEPRPDLIKYIEDRDIWKWSLPNSEEINSSIMSYDLTFENFDYLSNRFDGSNSELQMIREGYAINRKTQKDVQDLLMIKHMFNIGGFSVPAVNVPWMLNSDMGNELSKGYPFAATYFDGATHTVVSLRSQKDGGEDVSLVAKKYGGGGHKNAAAFRMPLGWRGDEV